MPRNRFLTCTLFVPLLLVSPFLSAVEEIDIDPPSTRTAAMGGNHVALADDFGTLFSNPAGFRSVAPQFSVAELTFGLSGPIFDIANVLVEGTGGSMEDVLSDPDVQNLVKSLYAGFNLLGPVAFGYVGNGLGFGFYTQSDLDFTGQGTVPKVTTKIEESFVFAGGYSFRLPLPEGWNSSLDVGALLKAFIHTRSSTTKDVLDLIDSFSDPMSLIVDEPFRLSLGIGLDLGVLYSYGNLFSVGLVGKNLPTPVLVNDYTSFQAFLDNESPERSNDFLPVDLTMGFLYRPPLGGLARYISDLKLMLDYEDILDFVTHPVTSKNPILHLGLGAEMRLLKVLALRAGFYQGLLNTGLGIDLSVLTLNLAIFGRELSAEPGLRPVYNVALGLEFRY